jgi:hypothetical protein
MRASQELSTDLDKQLNLRIMHQLRTPLLNEKRVDVAQHLTYEL